MKWVKIDSTCWGAGGGRTDKGKYIPLYTVYYVGDVPRGTVTWEAWKQKQLLGIGMKTRAEAMKLCRDNYDARSAQGSLL